MSLKYLIILVIIIKCNANINVSNYIFNNTNQTTSQYTSGLFNNTNQTTPKNTFELFTNINQTAPQNTSDILTIITNEATLIINPPPTTQITNISSGAITENEIIIFSSVGGVILIIGCILTGLAENSDSSSCNCNCDCCCCCKSININDVTNPPDTQNNNINNNNSENVGYIVGITTLPDDERVKFEILPNYDINYDNNQNFKCEILPNYDIDYINREHIIINVNNIDSIN
jgi:hypothetical protein